MNFTIKKSIAVIISFTLLFSMIILVDAKPVHASSPPPPPLTNVDIMDAVSDYVQIFDDYGIDSELLFNILALEKKGWSLERSGMNLSPAVETYLIEENADAIIAELQETRFLLEQVKQEPNINDISDESPSRGAPYSGNPPGDNHEQALRIEYLMNVLNRDYSASKYSSVRDKYMAYLYISHFIEDQNYNYGGGDSVTSSIWNSSYPHIICAYDITTFNSFLNYTQHSYMIGCMGKALSAADHIQTAITSYGMTRQEIINYIDDKGTFDEIDLAEVYNTLVSGGMSAGDAKNAIEQAFTIAETNYGDAEAIQEISDLIYSALENMTNTLFMPSEITSMSDTLSFCFAGLAEDIFMANMAGGIISGVSHSMAAISKGYMLAGMTTLYATLSARKADRLWIYLGFDVKP